MFIYKKDKFKVPIKVYMSKDEYFGDEKMVQQMENLAIHPFVNKQLVLTPDGHAGYGCPIGTVCAMKGAVCVNLVGVDIGCGMAAVKTSLTEISTEEIKAVMSEIRKRVPVGFKHHKKAQDESLMPKSLPWETFPGWGDAICEQQFKSALKQLGTLGGGNHFIEIQKGNDGHIWFMVHSGSRNLGYQVAKHYNKLAQELNERWKSIVPKKHELAFLPIETEEAKKYLAEMKYCLDFAQANRSLMVQRIQESFEEVMNKKITIKDKDRDGNEVMREMLIGKVDFRTPINIHHNYAQLEHHFGENVMIHRKGATSAYEGELGIIPGSQGTKSYIVMGLGNPESFKSCSHGAGRKMSRKKAQENLDLEEEKKKLDDKGIVHSIRNKKDLDEASSAYKDIDVVMEEQEDLVEIIVELEPMGVIKG